jgi:hypothetical protein
MEDAKMTPFILSPRYFLSIVVILLSACASVPAQETSQQQPGFYDVQMTKEEVYSYTNIKFVGDYSSFQSPSGNLVLGRTEAGVTIVVVLGGGTLTIEAPEAAREKFSAVFGAYPLTTSFKTLYMRLNPKEYNETFGKMSLTKAPNDEALAKAKELYDAKFLASYHAGPRAIFPPYKTKVYEYDTADLGQISYEEGYWLRLIRLSPYGKVYPSNFVNPKQKYALIHGVDGLPVKAD